MRSRITTMVAVGAGLISVVTMGAPAAAATTVTAITVTAITVTATTVATTTAAAAQETFIVLGVQARSGDRFVTLRCDPASGTHQDPESACAMLDAVDGDLTKIPEQPDVLCPNIYDPVTAIASGDYQGKQVVFRRTYPNRCDLSRHTAPIFEL